MTSVADRHAIVLASPPASSPTRGRVPVAAPMAGFVGAFLAVVLLALGVVALRDTAVYLGWLRGTAWLTTAINSVDGARPAGWMIPVGVALVIGGFWFTIAALSPRRRIATELVSTSSVWISPADTARIASRAAESVSGVLQASATANLRKVKVLVEATSGEDAADVRADVLAAVNQSLERWATAPKITIRIRRGDR